MKKEHDAQTLRDEMRAEAEAERAANAKTANAGNGNGNGGRTVEKRPLLRQKAAPKPYPVEALGDMAEYVRAAQRITQAPMAIAAHSALAAINYAAQAHYNVDLGFGIRPISEYFVTSAVSGERKSATDAQLMRAILDRQERLLIAAEERGADDDALSPVFVIGDPTADAILGHFGNSIGSLLLCNNEAGRMLGGYAFASENALATVAKYSELWDGRTTVAIRVTTGNRIVHGKRLCMALMGQPEVIARLYSPTNKGQGFTSRLLTAEPATTIGTREWRDPDENDVELMAEFARYLAEVLDAPLPVAPGTRNVLAPRAIPLSARAKRAIASFHDDAEKGATADGRYFEVRELALKGAEHVARLAATLAVDADFEPTSVDADFIDAGVTLMRWYLDEALRIGSGAAEEVELTEAEKLLAWMQAKGRGEYSLVELYQRSITAARSAKKARALIEILIEHGWVEKADGPVEFDGQPRREAYRLT